MQIDVILDIEAGNATLSMREWSKVRIGDFLIIENCSLSPSGKEGEVTLTINSVPLLRGIISGGDIKISERLHIFMASTSEPLERSFAISISLTLA